MGILFFTPPPQFHSHFIFCTHHRGQPKQKMKTSREKKNRHNAENKGFVFILLCVSEKNVPEEKKTKKKKKKKHLQWFERCDCASH